MIMGLCEEKNFGSMSAWKKQEVYFSSPVIPALIACNCKQYNNKKSYKKN